MTAMDKTILCVLAFVCLLLLGALIARTSMEVKFRIRSCSDRGLDMWYVESKRKWWPFWCVSSSLFYRREQAEIWRVGCIKDYIRGRYGVEINETNKTKET